MADQAKWNARYRDNTADIPAPSRVLLENRHLLPCQGRALDIACGRAANARLLASQGLETHAWDFSEIVIQQITTELQGTNLPLHPELRDVVHQPPAVSSFDVILVSHFLERQLIPALITALRPNGLIFYQTFIQQRVDDSGPSNPAYRLAPNELLHIFTDLQLLVYREEGLVGNTQIGFRNEAMLVARNSRD